MGRGLPILHISDVIKGNSDQVIAMMIMEVDVEDIIKPMLHTGEGLGEEGEALLVNQNVEILTSLKHPPSDSTITKPLDY